MSDAQVEITLAIVTAGILLCIGILQVRSRLVDTREPRGAIGEKKGKGSNRIPILAVLVLGLGISSFLYLYQNTREKNADLHEIQHSADTIGSLLQLGIEGYIKQIYTIAHMIEAVGSVDRSTFVSFTRPIFESHEGIQALEWIPRVPDSKRAAFEQRMQQEGLPDFRIGEQSPAGQMVPAERRDEYFPVALVQPLAGNKTALGFDLASSRERRLALEEARDSGRAVATERIKLVQEFGDQYGFLLFVPVYRGASVPATLWDRREGLLGFALGVFRIGDMLPSILKSRTRQHGRAIESALAPDRDATEQRRAGRGDSHQSAIDLLTGSPNGLLQFHLLDRTAPSGRQLLYQPGGTGDAALTPDSGNGADRVLSFSSDFDIAGRVWSVELRPVEGSVGGHARLMPWALAGIGLLTTLLLVQYLAVQRNRTREVERLVVERSRELMTVNQSLQNEIAEREAAEQRLTQKSKLEAVGKLTGGIAHEFNNLLMIIGGSISQAVQRLGQHDREAADTFLETAQRSVEKAASLTDQLLMFGGRRVMETKVFRIDRALEGLRDLMAGSLGELYELDIKLEDGGALVESDPNRIPQVIMSLVINARDALPDGGRITVRSKVVDPDPGFLAAREQMSASRYVEITVEDNGTGMDDDRVSRVFDPFYTTKEQGRGVGLGLSTAYGLASQCGGTVEIESEIGLGTTVRLYLPVVAGEPSPDFSEAQVAELHSVAGETILLVEDNQPLLALVSETFVRLGYDVVTAANGIEALEAEQDCDDGIDLLLSDVVMPSMGGFELATILREASPDLKIVFISGYPDRYQDHKTGIPENVRFVQKPIDPSRLAEIVRSTLDDRHSVVAS